MHQTTRNRVRRHVDSLRHDPGQLFAGLLDRAWIEATLAQQRVR